MQCSVVVSLAKANHMATKALGKGLEPGRHESIGGYHCTTHHNSYCHISFRLLVFYIAGRSSLYSVDTNSLIVTCIDFDQ